MPEDDQQKAMGRRLREARERSGLSQEQVAGELELQRPAISEIEAGRRHVKAHELAKLADLFHVSMEWLTMGKGTNPDKLEVAARGLAKLKADDLDKILELLQSLRKPD